MFAVVTEDFSVEAVDVTEVEAAVTVVDPDDVLVEEDDNFCLFSGGLVSFIAGLSP